MADACIDDPTRGRARWRTFAVAAAALVLGAVGTTAALGQTDSDPIHGCVNARTGDLRVVDDPSECRTDAKGGQLETVLSWNEQGPAGAPGPVGPQGPAGEEGALTDLAQLEGVACRTGTPQAGTVKVSYASIDEGAGIQLVCDPDAKLLTLEVHNIAVIEFVPCGDSFCEHQRGSWGTVTVTPPGDLVCGDPGEARTCTRRYDRDTEVTLTAEADAQSRFTGWSGACSGTQPTCTVTMSEARTVMAGFTVV